MTEQPRLRLIGGGGLMPRPRQSFVPIDSIALSGDNMREDAGDLIELAESIKDHGILQPLLVAEDGDSLVLVCGHRRLSAARKAGLDEVPVIIRKLDDDERLSLMIVENVHRRHLSVIEEGRAFKKLMSRRGMTQDQVASRVGKSQTYVSNRLKVLDLPESVQQRLHKGEIPILATLDAYREHRAPRPSGNKDTPGARWQKFYAERLTAWLETGRIEWDDEDLVEDLNVLTRVLVAFVKRGHLDQPILMCDMCNRVTGYIGRCCEEHDQILCAGCTQSTHDVEGAA